MKKFAIVIPSYNDPQGLWFTVAACRVDLECDFAPDDYEIIAVIDGPEDEDTTRVMLSMRQRSMCKIINANTRTPQKNRHIGLLATEAPYVFFLDSHVIPSRGFFKRMLATVEETGACLVHAGHCFWHSSGMAYGYNMDWKHSFWALTAESKPSSPEAYQVALAGHGAMVVNRAQYLEIGGYWHALEGWGGEEPQLNLKAWLMGKTVYMEPRVHHWHYMPMKRDLCGIQHSVRYAKNFMLVAYASGGQKYLDAIYLCFTQLHNGHNTLEEALAAAPVAPYQDVLDQVPIEAAQERAAICSGPFGGDVDRLRAYFTEKGIPN